METQSISRPGMKHRRANSLPNQDQRMRREKVNIPDDTWLEALKFMTCPQWMRKRYVSRQTNGIAERYVLRLPKMVIDSATMYYLYNARNERLEKLSMNTIVAFDTVMQEEQGREWFMERGSILDDPVDIPVKDAINCGREWTSVSDSNVHICILGPSQEKIPLSEEEKHQPWFYHLPEPEKFRKPVLYYAQFNPLLNDYSWNYLAHFLKLIYHPTSHIKEIEMFVVNQTFIDSLKCNVDSVNNAPRYICCESFLMETDDIEHEIAVLSDSLKWLSRNVRTENLYFEIGEDEFDLFANFLLDPSGAKQCASKKTEIDACVDPDVFFRTLINKPHVGSIFELYGGHSAHLAPNVIDQEVDSQDAGPLYVISTGHWRSWLSMRAHANPMYEIYEQFRIYPK